MVAVIAKQCRYTYIPIYLMYHDRTSSNYMLKHNFNAPRVFKHLFNTYLHKIEICNQIFMATHCRAANRIFFKFINKKVWIHSHWWPPWNNLMKKEFRTMFGSINLGPSESAWIRPSPMRSVHVHPSLSWDVEKKACIEKKTTI